jgi:hypothetical protein
VISFTFNGTLVELPEGAIIGVTGATENVLPFLRFAGTQPQVLAFEYRLDTEDDLRRLRSMAECERVRRNGGTVLLASRNSEIIRTLADELWWIDRDFNIRRGDVEGVRRQYFADVLRQATGSDWAAEIAPAIRRGDGRAEVIRIEISDPDKATTVIASGHETEVRVTIRFNAAVEDPVVGIMIRTRIGVEVYGTNTELENVKVGPRAPGDKRIIKFRFRCDLCPGYYTLTAASHDPDGVWHDWLEDAVAFTVIDSRYTAGVANLRAAVTCCRE